MLINYNPIYCINIFVIKCLRSKKVGGVRITNNTGKTVEVDARTDDNCMVDNKEQYTKSVPRDTLHPGQSQWYDCGGGWWGDNTVEVRVWYGSFKNANNKYDAEEKANFLVHNIGSFRKSRECMLTKGNGCDLYVDGTYDGCLKSANLSSRPGIPDYTRDPSPCPRRKSVEDKFGARIRRGGHYSCAIGNKGPNGLADHDWIYVGNGYVVEIPGAGYPVTKEQLNPSEYVTERVSPSELTLNSANNSVGKRWNYHMRNNNCQHFAYWCSTGYFNARTIFNKGNNQNKFCPIPSEPPTFERCFTDYPLDKKMFRPNPF